MRKFLTFLALAGLVSSLAFASSLSAAPGNKYENITRDADDDCQGTDDTGDGSLIVSITGPEKLWPPNHKYVPVSLTATDTDAMNQVELATEGTHDQYATAGDESSEINGAGNTTDDVSPLTDEDGPNAGSATTNHELRAERSGTDQTGRTYTITYEAMGGPDDSCVGSFTILVPHDMRGGADW